VNGSISDGLFNFQQLLNADSFKWYKLCASLYYSYSTARFTSIYVFYTVNPPVFYGCETRPLYCQCKGELQQFFKQGLFAFEVYANIPKLQIA
jgi:hypothetical protein